MLSHSEAGRFTSQFKTEVYEQESNVPRARRASADCCRKLARRPRNRRGRGYRHRRRAQALFRKEDALALGEVSRVAALSKPDPLPGVGFWCVHASSKEDG
jgi:hypothetical protein